VVWHVHKKAPDGRADAYGVIGLWREACRKGVAIRVRYRRCAAQRVATLSRGSRIWWLAGGAAIAVPNRESSGVQPEDGNAAGAGMMVSSQMLVRKRFVRQVSEKGAAGGAVGRRGCRRDGVRAGGCVHAGRRMR